MSDEAPPAAPRPRSYASRWKHATLLQGGYLVVPTAYLRHYAHLKPYSLTSGEALFVLHLMEFKWDADAPFPGYKTLAARMGVSDKMARRHAQNLETKGYLRRVMRTGQTNRFDLTPLFDALEKVNALDQAKAPRRRARPRAAVTPPAMGSAP
jgi:DNA-binding MarR family transcriptional regulator